MISSKEQLKESCLVRKDEKTTFEWMLAILEPFPQTKPNLSRFLGSGNLRRFCQKKIISVSNGSGVSEKPNQGWKKPFNTNVRRCYKWAVILLNASHTKRSCPSIAREDGDSKRCPGVDSTKLQVRSTWRRYSWWRSTWSPLASVSSAPKSATLTSAIL